MESNLIIDGIGFPRLSCRDVIQTLTPIPHGEIRRSVNGELCYVGTKRHHKYKSTVTCADQNLPGVQQLWVGATVTMQCVSTLWENLVLGAEGEHELSRPAVPGSIKIVNEADEVVEHTYEDGVLTLPMGEGEKVIVSYRPVLSMRITAFDFKEGEWEKGSQWRLSLEEI